jgi:hypothetical protein
MTFLPLLFFLGGWLATKTYYKWTFWNIWYLGACISQRLNWVVRQVWLEEKIIAYVKNEGSNLNNMIVDALPTPCETQMWVANWIQRKDKESGHTPWFIAL